MTTKPKTPTTPTTTTTTAITTTTTATTTITTPTTTATTTPVLVVEKRKRRRKQRPCVQAPVNYQAPVPQLVYQAPVQSQSYQAPLYQAPVVYTTAYTTPAPVYTTAYTTQSPVYQQSYQQQSYQVPQQSYQLPVNQPTVYQPQQASYHPSYEKPGYINMDSSYTQSSQPAYQQSQNYQSPITSYRKAPMEWYVLFYECFSYIHLFILFYFNLKNSLICFLFLILLIVFSHKK